MCPICNEKETEDCYTVSGVELCESCYYNYMICPSCKSEVVTGFTFFLNGKEVCSNCPREDPQYEAYWEAEEKNLTRLRNI